VNETDNITFLPFNDEAALHEYFKKSGNEVCAVITEGIQGVGGINVASGGFLKSIRQLCDQYNALFVADSVQCGYGRSGRFFSHDHAGVDADVYTMAKGMGNGFPVGGILIAPHIKPKHGMLGTTFGGAHLACAAALAVLEVMEEENLVTKAAENGAYLIERLKQIDGIENIRGRGLMIGFDVQDRLKDLRKILLQEQHVFTGEAKPTVVRLLPSLGITKAELDEFLEALQWAVTELRSLQPSKGNLQTAK
jgi:acetylornithine aminotransferase